MSWYILAVLMCVYLSCPYTHAVKHGHAPNWVLQRYCAGKSDQLVKLPWRCDGYLMCGQRAWFKCAGTFNFNEQTSSCVPASTATACDNMGALAAKLCTNDPTLKFPHPSSCAMYYDCSQTQKLDQYNLAIYENECPHPQLFDPDTGACSTQSPSLIDCENKPGTKCAYKKECISTPNLCWGKFDGNHQKPGTTPFWTDYIRCVQGVVVESGRCPSRTVFDPIVKSCSSNIAASLQRYCAMNPQAVFPDSRSCSGYYRCSKPSPYPNFKPYEHECLYRFLFDISTMACVLHSDLQTPCGSRFEPIDPCEYKVGHCTGRTYCIPCIARCKGKADGPHPYPNYPNTRWHIMCKGGRILIVLKCPEKEIYSPAHKRCLVEGSTHIIGKTTLPPAPTTPPVPTEPPVPMTTPPVPTEPPVPMTTPPVEQRVTDPSTDTCGCMGEISPMITSLTNLSHFVDEMYTDMQVPSPYHCDQPPLIENGNVEVFYRGNEAVASYSCGEGFELCGGFSEIPCTGDNVWSKASLGQCVKNEWFNTNTVDLACHLRSYSEIEFRGRAVEGMFYFVFLNEMSKQELVDVIVRVNENTILGGGSGTQRKTVKSPIPLVGLLTWRIRLEVWKEGHTTEIYVNDVFVMDFKRLTLIKVAELSIGPGFRTEYIKIKYNGQEESPRIRHLSSNLAHLKPVFASSHEGSSDADRITDGYAYRELGDASCWSVEPDDPQRWLLIDLRKEFYVSHLVFSTLECVGETCPKGVGEFKVTVSTRDPREGEIQRTVCGHASNEYLPSSSQTLTCHRGVTGRFIYIAFEVPYNKQTTVCEVEVYGGVASNSEWSPFSCPDPPIVESASLTLSYTHNEAIATYMCDESYVMCSGNDVIRCQDETGWYDSPGVCTKAVYEATNSVTVNEMHICPLRLGSALEMWLTFTDGYEMVFFQGDFLLLYIEEMGANTQIKHETFGDNPIIQKLPPIVRDKEIHLVFYSLSNHFLIKIDDEVYYKSTKGHFYFDHDIMIIHKDTVVRKAVYHPSVMKAFNREVLDFDLAIVESGRYVTSTFSSEHRVYDAVDTMLESCWIAKPSDNKQFLLLDLAKEFFIREVHVLPRLVSGDDLNLALGKTASGSANVDGNSNASHVVDGVLKTLPSQGSCFSSSTDAWWMVDLGKPVTVSSVAIQTRTDGNAEHHSQIVVTVYELNPFGSVEATDLLCFEYNSILPPFKRISCESPQVGQFVKIEKMTGATSSALTLCEVEIYSEPEGHQYDFSVDIYSTSTERGNGKRCGSHAGEFATGPIILACNEHTVGRYVMIQKDRIAENDQMNICDIKVYGDKVVEKVRSSEECGLPPLVANAYANISYSLLKAKATYTCFDGYYSCGGPTTIYCSDLSTWDETTVDCKRESDDVLDGVSDISFCPLNIGDTIEFFFTPTDLTFEIEMEWIKMISGPTGLNMDSFWSVNISPNPFTVDKESKIVITVFGTHLLVDIDGAIFRRRGYGISADIHEIKTTLGKLRRYSIKRWNEDIIEFRSFDANQALGKRVTVSSTMIGMEKESVVDGNLDYQLDSLKCWSVDTGDSSQVLAVHLGSEMYITHVTLTSPSCKVCEDQHGLHDFRIETFQGEPVDLCYDYYGTFPPSSTKTIYCTNIQYGDGVSIKALHANTNVLLAICEVQVFGGYVYNKGSKRNLALFGLARTRWSTTGFGPTLAVDGTKSISMDSKSCYKSKESITEPWWSVGFDDIYLIHQVAITTAESCTEGCEARDFIIEVGVDDVEALCLEYKGALPSGETTTLTCNKRIPGKLLKITMKGKEKTQILCEVEVYGDRITYEAETDVNLAENRPAFASSGVSDRGLVVDGNLNGGPNFCWTSEVGDDVPWLYVELDTFYLVSKVEITNREDCAAPCNTRLRSFLIDGLIERPVRESVGQLCAEQGPPIALDTSVMFECNRPVISRYVRFFGFKRTDVIHLCELKVFGRKAILTGGWSPSECPEPPALPHACVDVCYHDGVAVATYTCDSNYTMCTGSNTLTCSSEAGWEGSPGVCVQTTMEVNPGLNNQVLDVQVCHPKLGEGFELWVTPRHNDCTLEFLNDNKETMAAKITYYPGDVVVEYQYDTEENIKAFSLNQESHLTIAYTSKGLAITVDGKPLSNLPHVPLSTQIGFIRALGFVIRKLRPLPRYSKYLQRVTRDNLVASNSFASSEKSAPSNVVDKDVTQTLAKCWQPKSGNTDQWVAVQLEQVFFVRAVVLYMTSTACECDDARTHNFGITVHPTQALDDRAMTCAFYEGVLPVGAVERVACREDVWGRYVRIMKDAAYVQSPTDLLTFCEIEVYGDAILTNEWSPNDCPPPPDYPNAYSQIFKSSQESLAMYACKEDFTMCGNSGENKLTCSSDKGWEGQIAECVQTSRELPFGAGQDLEEFGICPFALGHALKIWFTSTGDSWRQLALTVDGSDVTQVSVILDPDRVELSTKIDGVQSAVTNMQDNFLTLGKEAVLTVYFVSQYLWVTIDGAIVDVYRHTIPPPTINFVVSQPDIKIRKMMQVQELPPGIITDSGEIKGSTSVLRVSSTEVNYSTDFIVDGIPGTAIKCWISKAEVAQWMLLDIGTYAFVKRVDIFGKRGNLALGKTASASSNFDANSDPPAAVNGQYGNNRLNGECYTSTDADAKNMLVVDLGKEYTVDAVAVQGRKNAALANQADDLVVDLYSTDPLLDSSATPKSCMNFVGRPEAFAVYPCDSPVKGRFIAFSRPGASKVLTLCEVEVFAQRATLGGNIKVEVLKVDDLEKPNNQDLCGIYEVDKVMNPYESIFCKERIWGRYISISRPASGDPGDVMSICDVRVVGETFNPPPM